jgi:hypothetical protein
MTAIINTETGEIVTAKQTKRLSADERAELMWREDTIARGLETFVEVGTALAAIRAKRLYCEQYATWDDYLAQRWEMSHGRASQLINGTETALHIAAVTSVTLPNENVARALRKFDVEMQPAIARLAQAVATSRKRAITAGVITAVGKVLTEAEDTGGYVSTPGGRQNALTASIVQEVDEVEKRQRQHIEDGSKWERLTAFEASVYSVEPFEYGGQMLTLHVAGVIEGLKREDGIPLPVRVVLYVEKGA